MRTPAASQIATGTSREQEAPTIHYLELLLGPDGTRRVIFEEEETNLQEQADAMLWQRASQSVTKILSK